MNDKNRNRPAVTGIVQVMLAAVLWGTVGVSTKLVAAAGMLPQEVLGLARLAVGGPTLLLLLVLFSRRSLSSIRALDPLWLVGFVLGCAIFQVCLFQAFVLLEVTTTVFITVCLPPVIATALSLLRADRSITAGDLSALGLAVAGLATFAIDGVSAGADSLQFRGLALAVLASAAFVLMTSAARRLTQATNPLVVAGAGLTLSALVLFALLPFVRFDAISPGDTSLRQLGALIIYLGLGPTALAYVLYCAGMARCRSANVGLVASMVEPAFAALLAWILLNERLSTTEMLGCALVMLAMLTLWESERRLSLPRFGSSGLLKR